MRTSNLVESKFMNTSQLGKDIGRLQESKRQHNTQLRGMQKDLEHMKTQRKYEGYDYPGQESQVSRRKT